MKTNKTIKLFWLYRAFSYDFVFYYTIATLYYTTTKGFTFSDVMLIHSFAAIATFLFILPITWVIKKIGNTASIRVGTFLWIIYLLATIFFSNFYVLLVFEALCSIGTIFKILSDSVIIVNTLEKNNQSDRYVKIESKGITTYFVTDCVCALVAGYIFNFNAYLPMILCLAFVVFSFVLSFFIKDETEVYKGFKFLGKTIDKKEESLENQEKKTNPIKTIFKNKKILKFLFFVISFYGLIMAIGYMQSIALVDLGFDSVMVGYFFVVAKLINALSSFLYGKFEKVFKKYFAVTIPFYFLVLILAIGLIFILSPLNLTKQVILFIVLLLLEFVKQPYKIYSKDCIKTYSTNETRQSFYSIYFMFEVFGDFLLCLIGSLLLESQTVGITYMILLAVSTIPIIISSILLYRVQKASNTLKEDNTNT